ncbi:tautomerase family protein [Peribacillus frigoritolerans]|nr:tautomerase family protein [Peribacillus frigoritolerans]
MPLLRFDLVEGRNEETLKKLLDSAHHAMVEAFQVPESDRYQIIHQHPSHELIIEDTGLGFKRSRDLVIISIVSKKELKNRKKHYTHFLHLNLKQSVGFLHRT